MKKTTRLPGFLYLGIIIFGIIAQIIRTNILVFGENIDVFEKINSSLFTLKIGFISDLIMMVFYLLTAWTLFNILKHVNKDQSLLFLICSIISVAILGSNMINIIAIIEINNANYINIGDNFIGFSQFLSKLHNYGYLISQVFFGLWLLPLGLIILKSKILPKYFGIMLIAATFGHFIEIISVFLFSGNEYFTYPGLIISMVGEFSFCFWLIFKGINIENRN